MRGFSFCRFKVKYRQRTGIISCIKIPLTSFSNWRVRNTNAYNMRLVNIGVQTKSKTSFDKSIYNPFVK